MIRFSMKQKAFKLLQYFLVALFVSYYCESTLFIHTHYFTWGTVTHSHPYTSNNTGHTHTATECQTIASITNVLLILLTTAVLCQTIRIITLFYILRLLPIQKDNREHCPSRAPPAPLFVC